MLSTVCRLSTVYRPTKSCLPRPCELQISDFENAAVCCFVVLLTRAILSFKWNLLMPISKIDENMKRAQERDAVLNQKFWWRKDIFTACRFTPPGSLMCPKGSISNETSGKIGFQNFLF